MAVEFICVVGFLASVRSTEDAVSGESLHVILAVEVKSINLRIQVVEAQKLEQVCRCELLWSKRAIQRY